MSYPPNINDLAAKRTELHNGQASQEPGAVEKDRLGIRGEIAFGEATGLPPDLKTYGGAGDDGVDFSLAVTIDVKTFRKPKNLLVWEGKVRASIYVLADGSSDDEVEFLGFAWRQEVLAARVTDWPSGRANHIIPAGELHSYDWLRRFIKAVSG